MRSASIFALSVLSPLTTKLAFLLENDAKSLRFKILPLSSLLLRFCGVPPGHKSNLFKNLVKNRGEGIKLTPLSSRSYTRHSFLSSIPAHQGLAHG